jgi:WhiB family redox-sensing transcriptional regulator
LETRQDQGVWGGLTEVERWAIHRRNSGTTWGRTRDVAQLLLDARREDFLALRAAGESSTAIAQALGTNTQTVHRMIELVAAEKTAEEVAL